MKKIVLIAALALLFSVSLVAAQATAVVKITWRILPFAVISLGGDYGQSVVAVTEVPTPTAADLARGYVEIPDAVTLRVMSNTHWTVFVQALSPTLGTSYDGRFEWPIDSLEIGLEGRFIQASTQPQELVSGHNGEFTLTVDYRVRVPETGVPDGDYQAVILYTVTTD